MLRIQSVVCLAILFSAVGVLAQDAPPIPAPAVDEHEFLKKFDGEWVTHAEMFMEPGSEPVESKGTMNAHMIGDFWVVIDLKGEMMGTPFHGQATFGFDNQKTRKYIGTWTDSMSDFLWHYEGTADGDKLVMNTAFPNPVNPDQMLKARDTWEFTSENEMLLTSEMEGPDGQWTKIMNAKCTRQK